MPLYRNKVTKEIVREIPGGAQDAQRRASDKWESLTEDQLAELRAAGKRSAARS